MVITKHMHMQHKFRLNLDLSYSIPLISGGGKDGSLLSRRALILPFRISLQILLTVESTFRRETLKRNLRKKPF